MTNSINQSFLKITKETPEPINQSGFSKLPVCIVNLIFSNITYKETAKFAHLLSKAFQNLPPNNEILDLSNTFIEDDYLIKTIHACQGRKIVSLILSGCICITDASMEKIASLKHLKTLNLSGCENITDVALTHIATLPQLRTLNLSYCDQFTGEEIGILTPLKQLRTLTLTDCHQIDDDALEHISTFQQLRTLDLYNCNHFSEIGIKHLNTLQKLRTLTLSSKNAFAETALEYLPALPQLKIQIKEFGEDSRRCCTFSVD